MAERRMFAKTIVTSDAFLDMPISARCLYFALGMEADDDGFVNRTKTVMRICGATLDDLNVLAAKKFIIPFPDGVVVIKHWRINNYLRNDRYVPTKYGDNKACLTLDENNAYVLAIADDDEPTGIPNDNQRYTTGIPTVSKRYPQDSIGKDSIGNNIVPKGTPSSPSAEDEFEVVEDDELDELLASVVQKHEKSILSKQQKTRFEKFYELYPKKQGRQNAEKVWKKLNPSEEETNTILIGLKNAIEHDSRFREQRFTPMPATWLNAGSWDDEYQEDIPQQLQYQKKTKQKIDDEHSFDADDFLEAAVKRSAGHD